MLMWGGSVIPKSRSKHQAIELLINLALKFSFRIIDFQSLKGTCCEYNRTLKHKNLCTNIMIILLAYKNFPNFFPPLRMREERKLITTCRMLSMSLFFLHNFVSLPWTAKRFLRTSMEQEKSLTQSMVQWVMTITIHNERKFWSKKKANQTDERNCFQDNSIYSILRRFW